MLDIPGKFIFGIMYTKTTPLIAVILLFTGMITAHAQAKKVVADKIIAVVGDKIILQSDIKNSIEGARSEGMDLAEEANCVWIEQAMVTKILLLQALKDSLQITGEEVEAQLDQRIRYFIKLLGGVQKLEDYARKPIYQIKEDARESVRENMLTDAMQRKIINGVKITPAEVAIFFNRLPKDSLPFIESKFEIGQITVIPKASADMERYVISELNNYKRQIANKVSGFEQLARLYSEHIDSKKSGGNYQLNRNDKTWGDAFLSAVFRLKNGEVSDIIRSDNSEYFLIQMVERRGDDADIRLILRTPPITDAEITEAGNKLDTVRSKIIAGVIGFNEAALNYSDGQNEKFIEPFLLNRNGSPYVTIRDMDNEMVVQIGKMKVGEISEPTPVTIGENKKAARIIYLKSRSEPHRMNLKDDYSEIAQTALDEKRQQVLYSWIQSKKNAYSIMIDETAKADCDNLQSYARPGTKGF
jgi:peptidyl-prolyl cis-trans isomerase SurA